jgi:hypothetical protein
MGFILNLTDGTLVRMLVVLADLTVPNSDAKIVEISNRHVDVFRKYFMVGLPENQIAVIYTTQLLLTLDIYK